MGKTVRILGCAALLAVAARSGDKRADAWESPANRARLTIKWIDVAEVTAGHASPPLLFYVRGEATKKSARIEGEILTDTAVVLAARVCRFVRVTPDQAISLPFLKGLPQIVDPMLIVVGSGFDPRVLSDERKLTPASCLELVGKVTDEACGKTLSAYLVASNDILQQTEKIWRDEKKLAADEERAGAGASAEAKADFERRRADLSSAKRELELREATLLAGMRATGAAPSEAGEEDRDLTDAERQVLSGYRDRVRDADPLEAAWALGALRGKDSAAMARTVLKEARRGPWSAWRAGDVLAEMRSPGASQVILDAISKGESLQRAAALAAVAGRSVPETQTALLALSEDRDPAVREAVTRALAAQASEATLAALTRALGDKDPGVRVLAARGLGARGGAAQVPELAARLKDTDWCVQKAAAEALGNLRVKGAVPPLLDCLASADGTLRETCRTALGTVTGQTFGFDAKEWSAWWAGAQGSFVPSLRSAAETQTALDAALKDSGFRWPLSYSSVGTLSKRVVWAVDLGVSMGGKMELPPDATDAVRARLWRGSKLDLAKEELLRALDELVPDALFNVFAYARQVRRWRGTPGRGSTRKAVFPFVRELSAVPPASVTGNTKGERGTKKTSGVSHNYGIGEGGREHDVCAAVLAALGISFDEPLLDRSRPAVDTVFLVVDSPPDAGEAQSVPAIAELVRELNRSRGVVIHVVVFDETTRHVYAPIAAAAGGRLAVHGP